MAVVPPEQLQYLTRRRLGLKNVADTKKRRLGEDYGIDSRLLSQNSAREQKTAGEQLSSQGLYHSGIRVNEQGNIQREANQALSDLNLSRSRGLEDISHELATGLAQVDYEQSAALAEANRREQEERLQRSLLEAQRNAMMVGQIGYPGSVISGGGQQGGNNGLQGVPAFVPSNGRNPYNSFQAFRAANPQLAGLLTLFAGGNHFDAERAAIRQGYIIPVRRAPVGGRQNF